jgi:hypothetical protein
MEKTDDNSLNPMPFLKEWRICVFAECKKKDKCCKKFKKGKRCKSCPGRK